MLLVHATLLASNAFQVCLSLSDQAASLALTLVSSVSPAPLGWRKEMVTAETSFFFSGVRAVDKASSEVVLLTRLSLTRLPSASLSLARSS